MRSKGIAYEQVALHFLASKGLKKIDQNFASRYGEIDLIMKDDTAIVFVEVRYRENNRHGTPSETINKPKQRKIIKTAQYYLSKHKLWHMNCRFDVVAITSSKNDTTDDINWIQSAFIHETTNTIFS
mgnify:CR=1 FL=1|jgi:putative endonuclease